MSTICTGCGAEIKWYHKKVSTGPYGIMHERCSYPFFKGLKMATKEMSFLEESNMDSCSTKGWTILYNPYLSGKIHIVSPSKKTIKIPATLFEGMVEDRVEQRLEDIAFRILMGEK